MAFDRRTAAIAVLVVLTAGVIGVAAGAVVNGSRTGTGTPEPAAASGATEEPLPPSTPAATSAAPPSPSPGGVSVPVYVLGDTESGPRLYREFRTVPGSPADRVRLAAAALAGTPLDGDYRSPWAGVPLAGLAKDGTTATLTFGAAPRLRAAGDAPLAVQQVVHTVTAADPAVKQVRVVAPGLSAALTGRAWPRSAHLDVLAPVWVLAPADGARSGGKVVLSGTASVFEASVAIEVRRGAEVAARTTATATVGAPDRGEWTTTVTLPPGDYVVAAYEISAKDGSRQFVDTKRVVVTGR